MGSLEAHWIGPDLLPISEKRAQNLMRRFTAQGARKAPVKPAPSPARNVTPGDNKAPPVGQGRATPARRPAAGSEASVRGEIGRKKQAANWLSFGRDLGTSKDRLGWTVASIDTLIQRVNKDPSLLKRIGGALEVRIGANVFSGPVAQLMLLSMIARPEERKAIREIISKTNSIHGAQRARILDILDPGSNPKGFRTNGFVATRDQIAVLRSWLDWENFQDKLNSKRFGVGLGLALAGIGSAARGRGVSARGRGAPGSARRLRLLQNATNLARRGLGPAAAKQAAASLASAQRLARRLIARRLEAGRRVGEVGRGSGVLPRPKHTANVVVRRGNGDVRVRTRFVSGNMTAKEKKLGYPQRLEVTHTEVRAINSVKLKPGETMEFTGLQRPCNSCKGQMNILARKNRVRFVYKWRENGRTKVWIADGR